MDIASLENDKLLLSKDLYPHGVEEREINIYDISFVVEFVGPRKGHRGWQVISHDGRILADFSQRHQGLLDEAMMLLSPYGIRKEISYAKK